MAKFRVLKSKNIDAADGKRVAHIEYEVLEGVLLPGDVFRLYETHHYTNFQIIELQESYFVASPYLFYDGWYEGAELDTDNLLSGRKHGYSVAGKNLYTNEAIESLNKEGDR
ncbi:MAG: hypothetical protein G8D89_05470 [gamma proteobacterium symbiont of Clathrolucina costata]